MSTSLLRGSAVSATRFTIPMRGNEALSIPEVDALPVVYDPHEG